MLPELRRMTDFQEDFMHFVYCLLMTAAAGVVRGDEPVVEVFLPSVPGAINTALVRATGVVEKACASYYTLSRFDSGQDWLDRSTTAMPFCNCGIPKRFIERVVAAVANDAAEKTGAGPFMHRHFGNAKRVAHLFSRQ
jgi:hypothetical protein